MEQVVLQQMADCVGYQTSDGLFCPGKHTWPYNRVVDNCQPYEVVGRDSETQLHVAENECYSFSLINLVNSEAIFMQFSKHFFRVIRQLFVKKINILYNLKAQPFDM